MWSKFIGRDVSGVLTASGETEHDDSEDDEHNSDRGSYSQDLAEECHYEHYSGDRFESAEDGDRNRADTLD